MNGFINLKISGLGLNYEELETKSGKSPDFTYRKGDVYKNRIIKSQTKVYKEDCRITEMKICDNESIDNCTDKFIFDFRDVS